METTHLNNFKAKEKGSSTSTIAVCKKQGPSEMKTIENAKWSKTISEMMRDSDKYGIFKETRIWLMTQLSDRGYAEYCARYPIRKGCNGLYGYKRYLDGIDMRYLTYGSPQAAGKARKKSYVMFVIHEAETTW